MSPQDIATKLSLALPAGIDQPTSGSAARHCALLRRSDRSANAAAVRTLHLTAGARIFLAPPSATICGINNKGIATGWRVPAIINPNAGLIASRREPKILYERSNRTIEGIYRD